MFHSRLLLQNNADVNIKDCDGWTPLHAASHWGQKEAVELLVENMADMDAKNKLVGIFVFVKGGRFDLYSLIFISRMDIPSYEFLVIGKSVKQSDDIFENPLASIS